MRNGYTDRIFVLCIKNDEFDEKMNEIDHWVWVYCGC